MRCYFKMKVFKNILFLLLITVSTQTIAQQGITMMPLEQDSAKIELERQIEYRQLILGKPEEGLFNEKIEMPGFDLQNEYKKRYKINLDIYTLNSFQMREFSFGMLNPFYTPFYQNGMVLSEAAYQFGDKFILGGYSYGVNSIFSAPLPNHGTNFFDTYGNTLFMQYKVSKNFKIETRVNVTQGRRYGF